MRTVVVFVANVNNLYGHTLTFAQNYLCGCVYMPSNSRLVFVLRLYAGARMLRYLFASVSMHSGSFQGLPLIPANP